MFWESIKYVSSGVTLVAFIVAALLTAYRRTLRSREKQIEREKQAMIDLGLEPKVRHNYECARNTKRQKVTYRCQRCGTHIERSRKLPRHRKYIHASCGGGLRLVSVQAATVEAQSA